jgi:hypothetical protein
MTPEPADEGLFDAEPYQVTPAPELGVDARRTLRQLEVLATGYHPVSRLKLHPDAPPAQDRRASGPRCGDCAHLFRKVKGSTYLKCGENATGGPATDLRAWWPACAAWKAVDAGPATI